MTREAKIGLLVGLAFLLVIGLLLSDHVTSVSREPPAPLTSSAGHIRTGLAAPGGRMTQVVLPPEPVAEPAVPYVDAPEAEVSAEVAADVWVEPQATAEAVPADVDPFAELRVVAATAGEPVEDVAEPDVEPVAPVDDVGAVDVIEYAARPGDSLGRIAARFLGRDTPANRARIIALNPSLAAAPHWVVAGRSYKLPADAGAAGVVAPETVEAAKPRTYTVASGDSLSQIAQRQLGSTSRQSEIVALNRDVLADPDRLQVGTVLRLPAAD